MLLLLALLACSTPPAPSPSADPRQVQTPAAVDPVAGFLASPQLYHEPSWDAVRGRTLTHLAAVGRDLARVRAQRGDWAGCAARYQALATELAASPARTEPTRRVRDALASAAQRDAALCAALARDEPPPLPDAGVARIRARYHRIVAGLDEEAAFRAEIAAFQPPTWTDAADRSVLRARLVEAWVDSLDPLAITDPWGAWTAAEATRQVDALARALEHRAEPEPHLLPGRLFARAEGRFTALELGGAPNGDSYVDTGGVAGPVGMGAPEPRYLAEAADFQARDDAGAAAGVIQLAARVAAGPDGARLARQVRNTGVRVLARRGAWVEALRVLASSWPLVAFDQACPDRVATLHGLEGRLRFLAGDPDAEGVLQQAAEDARAFLAKVAEAEARVAPEAPGLRPVLPPNPQPPGRR